MWNNFNDHSVSNFFRFGYHLDSFRLKIYLYSFNINTIRRYSSVNVFLGTAVQDYNYSASLTMKHLSSSSKIKAVLRHYKSSTVQHKSDIIRHNSWSNAFRHYGRSNIFRHNTKLQSFGITRDQIFFQIFSIFQVLIIYIILRVH